MKKIFLSSCILLLSTQIILAQVSGVKAIPGDYNSITEAVQHIRTVGVSGPVFLELQTGYNSAGETFPIKIRNIPGISAVNSLTISPASGASEIDISSATAGAAIELIGAYNINIDGRPGRTGSASELTIRNSAEAGKAISFTDGAVNNSVAWCRLERSLVTSINSDMHVVYFGRSGEPVPENVLLVNSCNVISNCIVASPGPPSAFSIIKAEGTLSIQNAFNKIIDNEILNFWFRGIEISEDGGGSDWTITGNSFYIPNRNGGSVVIYFQPGIASVNNTISGNFIGGQAAQAGGGQWIVESGFDASIIGILITAGSVIVENNVIQNFKLESVAFGKGSRFTGISLIEGSAQIRGNQIGGTTEVNGIALNGPSHNRFHGISNLSCSSVSIENNRISNITMQSPFPTSASNFVGIEFRIKSGTVVTGNQIDQVTASSTGTISFTAIRMLYSAVCLPSLELSAIDHNLVSNITLTSDDDSANFTGIELADGLTTNTGNIIGSATEANSIIVTGKIANATAILANESPDASISDHIIGNITVNGTLSALLNGIRFQNGGVAKINSNKLSNLSVSSSGPADMVGIGIKGTTSIRSAPSTLHNNQVYKINVSSTDNTGSFTGIEINERLAGNTANIIGSATEANSIMVTGKSASANGIRLNNSPNVSISDDIIANITAVGTTDAALVNGIVFEAGAIAKISSNQVHHLTAPETKGIFIKPVNGSSEITLEKNTLTGTTNNTGTGIETFVASEASLNLIATDNTVSNWQTGVLLAAASGVTLQQSFQNNAVVANQTGFINNNGAPVNATCNWWGDASGPSGAGPGTGDPVGANVIFSPWATIPEFVAVNAGTDQTIYIGYGPTSQTLTAAATACGTPEYLWSTGATTSSITVSPTSTTIYTVLLTDANGHTASDGVTVFVQDTRCGKKNEKVKLCHKGIGNQRFTLCVSQAEVPGHLGHGDVLGDCVAARGKFISSEAGNAIAEAKIKGEEKITIQAGLNAYPNPAKNILQLQWNSDLACTQTIEVMDLQGRTILNQKFMQVKGNNYRQLSLFGFKSGTYLLKMSSGRQKTVKLIVVK